MAPTRRRFSTTRLSEPIKSIPSTWDETHVLPFSEIGEVAAFARRHGKRCSW
jgi:hypothetical protein